MAKKSGGNGRGKTPTTKNGDRVAGGKKTPIPKNPDGSANWKKFAEDVKKPGIEPKNFAKRNQVQTPVQTSPQKTNNPAKGISKLKAVASKQQSSTPLKKELNKTPQTPKQPSSKGISKLKAATPKTSSPKAKAPVKKGPSKGR